MLCRVILASTDASTRLRSAAGAPSIQMRRLPLILAICIVALLAAAAESSATVKRTTSSKSLQFDLIPPRAPNANPSRLDFYRSLAIADIRRTIGRRSLPDCSSAGGAGGRNASPLPAPADSFSTPILSGAFAGTGQYFTRFHLGTPEQSFLLVADTGSDLTWVTCQDNSSAAAPSPASVTGGGLRRVFAAEDSKTFQPINCSSGLCKNTLPFSLSACPAPSSPCDYNYQYADGSLALGFFANESSTIHLSNGGRDKLRGLVIGCTSSSSGSGFVGSDGVLGLGYSSISFAVAAAARFGGKFSYCLVDHLSPRNVTSYLIFGANPFLRRTSADTTDISTVLQPSYAVTVAGISVAGEELTIPAEVWNVTAGGGVVIDSGTTLTILAKPAYDAVTEALTRTLTGIPQPQSPPPPFEFCYNWTSPEAKKATVPELTVRFSDAANLTPPAKSYLIDVAPGVKCLGIVAAPWPSSSTIGNILQQDHIWEFDLRRLRLTFQPSNCSKIRV